ncbi:MULTISPECIES: PAQR family membrane homeostasis protein TrhA [Piscirickettsiaceae]|jgi:hemolysin III|uniref:Hemolysin III family protein n=1 Tax=Hydrogenovibrio thermophilus TaxID=265883 RepID=A0A410H2V0_9GAMM|nr:MULTISPECIES: hemolysin III family protein [Piscirickettsiaceae]AZR82219.1 hemolysin III [Thiomicrospira sp. S5]QAB15244.1 hemolysin III family protein [Hydrogenovibrio thermophilus]
MYYSEKFNSITHLVGAVFALMGLGALIAVGILQNDALLFIGFLTFGLTLVMLYSFSTLYHSFKHPLPKRIFQKLDHISIYLLIAGTYTPFTLVTLIDSSGLWILIIVWSLAIIGILLDLFIKERIEWLQLAIYLIMGWMVMFDFSHLKEALPTAGLYWLAIGGIAYTAGIIFYILDDKNLLRHAHGIWHLFVLAGSVCHFIAVIGYIR